MKELLRSLITVNTFKGSDSFYFKNAPIIGTVNGKEAYCVFYYSHYDEYMVFAIAWKGEGFAFHYLNEENMLPTHEHHYRTLDEAGQFVPAVDVINILPNYMELVYKATQEQENIEHNAKYSALYDRQREIAQLLDTLNKDKGYNHYDEETYLLQFPLKLESNEYDLLQERYVNLKPDEKKEAELEIKKAYSKKQILSQMAKDKKSSDMMRSILDEILNEK